MRTTKSIIEQARENRLNPSSNEKAKTDRIRKELSKRFDFSSENNRPRNSVEKEILDRLK